MEPRFGPLHAGHTLPVRRHRRFLVSAEPSILPPTTVASHRQHGLVVDRIILSGHSVNHDDCETLPPPATTAATDSGEGSLISDDRPAGPWQRPCKRKVSFDPALAPAVAGDQLLAVAGGARR